MLKPLDTPSPEKSSSSKTTEELLDEFLAIIEPDGYLGLVQRDKSEWGSIYVWLHYHPRSIHQLPRPSNFTFRVSNHPPPNYLEGMVGSVHPGQEDVAKEWRKAKAKIKAFNDERKRIVESHYQEYKEVSKFIDMRKRR